MLKCLACGIKVYGAIPMLQHFQVGICEGLSATKKDNNATIEELDTRGGVGEKAWPSLTAAATSSPERKKTMASTVRVFNPIKKEKKEKLNIHKFTAEQRAAMSYSSPAVAREAMAQPAAEGWGEEGMAEKPVDLDWSSTGNKAEVVAPAQPSVETCESKRAVAARRINAAITLPALPKFKSHSSLHQTVSRSTTPATSSANASSRDIVSNINLPAAVSRPAGNTKPLPARQNLASTPHSIKPPPSSTPSPTNSSPSPHSQDIWDTHIPSTSSSTTPSSSITNHNIKTWSDTNGKHASSPLISRSQTYKQSRASTPKTQKPQDQWEGRDGWADAVELRKRHLEQTRKNMLDSGETEREVEEKSVSDWW